MESKWDRRFMEMARMVAGWSKDPSSQVGAVITRGKQVVSLGYNGFPSGIADDDRLNDRETKYALVLHAEMNAVLAARQDLTGCSIYIWPYLPCQQQCSAMLIQAGIKRVVTVGGDRYAGSVRMLEEAGVEVDFA